jgi:alpha-beta hydrolase superfamily lysophospholipase
MVVDSTDVFRLLAERFANHGIAVLRYDERGVGASEGDLKSATADKLVGDVRAAVKVLDEKKPIHEGKIGIYGHSGGALIAAEAVSRSQAVDFIVLASAPALPAVELIPEQAARFLAKRGRPSSVVDSVRARRGRFLRAVAEAPDSTAAASRLRALLEERGMTDSQIEERIRKYTSTRFRELLDRNPRAVYRQVDVPVLALYGGEDQQVPPDLNAEPLRSALREGRRPQVKVKVFLGLDHFLQQADSDAGNGVSVERGMAKAAFTTIAEWIDGQSP